MSADRRRRMPRWLRGWARDTSGLYLSQVLLTGMATAVSIVLARELSPRSFGVFSSFLGFSQALSFVIDVGLPTWLLREAVKDYEAHPDSSEMPAAHHSRLWRAMYTVGATGTFLAIATAVGSVALGLGPQLALAEALFIVYVAILALSASLETDFRAQRRPGIVARAFAIERTAIVVFVVVAVIFERSVLGIAVAFAAGGALRLQYSFRRSLGRSRRRRPRVREWPFDVVRRSAPFAANTAALAFLPRLDTALVGLVSAVAASYFALGFQVVTTLFLLPGIASSTLYPYLGRLSDPREARRIALALAAGTGVAAAALGYLVTPALLPAIFGHKYAPGVPTVQIMLIASVPAFVGWLLTTLLYVEHRERAVTRAVWIPSLMGTGIVVAGAIQFGAVGAAAGFSIRYALQAIALALTARWSWRRPPAGACEDVASPVDLSAHVPLLSLGPGLGPRRRRDIRPGAGHAVPARARATEPHPHRIAQRRTPDLVFTAVCTTLFVSSWTGLVIPVFSHPVQLALAGALFLTLPRAFVGGLRGRALPAWLWVCAIGFGLVAVVQILSPPDPLMIARAQFEALLEATPGTIVPTSGSNGGNLVRFEVSLLILPLVVVACGTTTERLRQLASLWVAGIVLSAAVAVVGVVVHVGFIDRLVVGASSAGVTHRQQGLTAQPNHLGVSCVIALPIALLWLRTTRGRWRVMAIIGVLLLTAAVIASGSRGATVGALVALLLGIVTVPDLRRIRAPLVGLAAVAVVVILLTPGLLSAFLSTTRLASGSTAAAGSDVGRAVVRNAGLTAFEARPLFGAGFSYLTTAHSIYIQLLSVGGLVALVLFGTLIVGAIRAGLSAMRHEMGSLGAACVVSIVAWLALGAVENELSDIYLFVPLSLALAGAVNARGQPTQPSVATPGSGSLVRVGARSGVAI